MRRTLWFSLALAGILALLVGVGAIWWHGRPERYLKAAESLVDEGEADAALAWLALPEETLGTRDRALLLRARIAVERGMLNQAVQALDRVDPHAKLAGEFSFWKGRTLLAAKQPRLAIPWFEAAIQARPNDADAERWLAVAAYDLGDRSRAVRALEHVTQLDPRDAKAWRTLGLIYKENVEYEQARPAFETALRLEPGLADVRLALAETLLQLGELDQAEQQLALCRGRVAEADRDEILAQCRQLRGDAEGWRAAVAEGLALAPKHPGLLTQQARIDLMDGHPAEALARLDRAVAIDPYRAETLYQRAVALRMLGRTEDADRDLARSAELKKNLAEMSRLNDEAAKAPQDAEVRYQLGKLCESLGKPELAASWFRAAIACDPKHEAARRALSALGP